MSAFSTMSITPAMARQILVAELLQILSETQTADEGQLDILINQHVSGYRPGYDLTNFSVSEHYAGQDPWGNNQ